LRVDAVPAACAGNAAEDRRGLATMLVSKIVSRFESAFRILNADHNRISIQRSAAFSYASQTAITAAFSSAQPALLAAPFGSQCRIR
jgi:hypothetical protein